MTYQRSFASLSFVQTKDCAANNVGNEERAANALSVGVTADPLSYEMYQVLLACSDGFVGASH